jgi:hypothetical protein
MRFSFICGLDQAGKMDRVVAYADGRVISKEKTPYGAFYVVEKT